MQQPEKKIKKLSQGELTSTPNKIQRFYNRLYKELKKTSHVLNKELELESSTDDKNPWIAEFLIKALFRVYMPQIEELIKSIELTNIEKYVKQSTFRNSIIKTLKFRRELIGLNRLMEEDKNISISNIFVEFIDEHLKGVISNIIRGKIKSSQVSFPKLKFKNLSNNYDDLLKILTFKPTSTEFSRIIDNKSIEMSENEIAFSFKEYAQKESEKIRREEIEKKHKSVREAMEYYSDLLKRKFFSISDTSDNLSIHDDYKFPQGMLLLFNEIKKKEYKKFYDEKLLIHEKKYGLSVKAYKKRNVKPISLHINIMEDIEDLFKMVPEDWDKIKSGDDLDVNLNYIKNSSAGKNRKEIKTYNNFFEEMDKLIVKSVEDIVRRNLENIRKIIATKDWYTIKVPDSNQKSKFNSLIIRKEYIDSKINIIKILDTK